MSLHRYVRFIAVGGLVGIATVGARGLIAHSLGADTARHYSVSVVTAYGLGILLSFALNRRFTFQEESASRAPWRALVPFTVFALAGLGSTWMFALLLRYGLALGEVLGRSTADAAFAVAAILSTAITYPLNARLVFGRRPSVRRAADCSSSRPSAREPHAARSFPRR